MDALADGASARHHHRVQTWLPNAPRWVHCVLTGLLFGSIWALLSRVVNGESWTVALVTGAFCGIFFGLVFGRWLHRQNVRTRAQLGAVPPRAVRGAARAAGRGTAPDDPVVRAATLAVVEGQQATLRRQRVLQRTLSSP